MQDPQDSGYRKGAQRSAVEDQQPTQKIPETPPEDVRAPPAQPGANLPPQLQAEGEAFTNELLEYLLQDLSAEGLDHLINRQTRRQQGKFGLLRTTIGHIKSGHVF